MAETLDSLFDSPPGPSRIRHSLPPRTPSLSPSPRRATSDNPLFLSPGDTPSRPTQAQSRLEHDTGRREDSALFDDVEYGGVPVSADRGIPTYDLGGGFDPLAGLGDASRLDGGEDGQPGKKKRKPIPKIDAERLMSEDGLPALMKSVKRFKVRGKGSETADLQKLMSIYQLWAHKMFPKGDFLSTMTRVENQLRTRRMESAMKGYRDAFYPRPRSASPPAPLRSSSPGFHPLTPPSDDDHNGSTPLFAPHADEVNDDIDADMDEIAAMEEMEREAEQASRQDAPPPLPVEEEDEFEGLYD